MSARILFLILLLLPVAAPAQEFKAVPISLSDGLSQSSVYDITQDKQGYIWMATQDGLNRYDGRKFEVFREEPFDSTSLSSNFINHVFCDSKGRLWVGTAGEGLNLFLPETETFYRFFENESGREMSGKIITHIHEDNSGTLWIGTGNGLYRVNEGKGEMLSDISFEHIPLMASQEDSVSGKFVSCIANDNNRQLWVSTFSGIYKIDITTKEITSDKIVCLPQETSGYPKQNYQVLMCDHQGRIWAGGGKGILLYNSKGAASDFISHESSNQSGMPNEMVTSLFAASDGRIWAGFYNNGIRVIKWDVKSERFDFTSPEVNNDLQVLRNGHSISFHEDNITKGLIWTGFNAGGAVRLVPVTKKFVTNRLPLNGNESSFVVNILKDDNNVVWVGTGSGLVRYNRNDNNYRWFIPSEIFNHNWMENHVTGVVFTKDNNVLFGAGNGLYLVDTHSSDFKVKRTWLPDTLTVNRNNLRTIYTDHNGDIYLILRYGIFRYEPEKEIFEKILLITDQSRINDKGLFISSVYRDGRDNFWVGTSMGLEFYKKSEFSVLAETEAVVFRHNPADTTSLRNQNILCVHEDKTGNIWIGTMNGLSKMVTLNGKTAFLNYSTRNGLNNNVIYSILTDEKTGHLWLSTNNGLIEFNPSGEVIANYDEHDGLQSNEFNSYAAYKADDGEMFFGGIAGYTSFYPDQILTDKTPPLVSISGITVNGNRSIGFGEGSDSKSVDLKYRDNTFTVNFAGLHYVDPQKVQYAYMLEGFQDDWIYSGSLSSVNFSQLPPGKYVFRVKASNSDGVYNELGDMFVININPPFYKTIWFYLLIALAIAGIIYGLFKYRLKIKMEKVKEVEQIRRATAADFHDELGHKLTIISWFAEILKKKIGPEQADLRPHLDKIIEASANLYHTMKDMLWAMDPDKDSVYDLYNQIKEFGLELFDNTGVEFEASDIPGTLKENIISPAHKRHVLLIFKEVMHNSLKHAHGSATTLDLVANNGHLKFRFRDNGQGFKLNGNGSGRGLDNIKRRARQINAEIDIHSESNGTVAELTIASAHLN